MKKFWFQVIGLLLVAVVAMTYMFSPSWMNILTGGGGKVSTPVAQPGEFVQKRVRIVDPSSQNTKAVLTIDLADTKEKRAQGLSGRESLSEEEGMLFLFDTPDKYSFWMKGMKIPLDFLWIEGNKVVGILPNVSPPTGEVGQQLPVYTSSVPIDKVLEVKDGFIQSKNIQIGDTLEMLP